jgi:ABC-type phosphate transport system substrate-binding protein
MIDSRQFRSLQLSMIALILIALILGGIFASQTLAISVDNSLKTTDHPTASETSTITLPPVDPSALEGDVETAGSSVVFPLAEEVVGEFQDAGFAGSVSIGAIGTGGGFFRFCEEQQTDIANASRLITPEERTQCGQNGLNPIPFHVGSDALAIFVHPDNDFFTDAAFTDMDKAALRQALATADSWQELGGPDQPINRFYPGTDGGEFDFMVEAVFDGDVNPILDASNLSLSKPPVRDRASPDDRPDRLLQPVQRRTVAPAPGLPDPG